MSLRSRLAPSRMQYRNTGICTQRSSNPTCLILILYRNVQFLRYAKAYKIDLNSLYQHINRQHNIASLSYLSFTGRDGIICVYQRGLFQFSF